MKLRYRLFQRSTGIFFMEDRVTGKQASLQTRDKIAAQRIFNAKNESHQQPAINLQIARAYLMAVDPQVAKRNWQHVMEEILKFKKGATLQHPADFLFQRPRAPALKAAHLRVKVALERVGDRDDGLKVRPTQLSPQCGDNLFIRKNGRKLNHPMQVFLAVTTSKLPLQLSPQCGDKPSPCSSGHC